MTYSEYETSVKKGSPFFLYQFTTGEESKFLTSQKGGLTQVMSEDWEESSIAHGNIESTGDINKSDLDIIFPLSDEFGRSLLVPITKYSTTVTIWRGHNGDPDNELTVEWKGRMVGSEITSKMIKVKTENIFTSMKRPGCRVRYQRNCRHALYFDGCNLVYDDWKTAATVTGINGLTMTVPELGDAPTGQYYLAGIVEWDGNFGFIQQVSGTTLTLVSPIFGMADALDDAPGGELDIFLAPGCRLTREYCDSVFDNVINFGGFPYIPTENPFEISLG